MNTAPKLTPHEERAVAVRAGCDPRTVRAILRGRRTRSTVASRVVEALRELHPTADLVVQGGADLGVSWCELKPTRARKAPGA